MPGEFFFLTFGGLGISLAGFAGLIFVLDRRPSADNAISRWRIRHIAISGLLIAQGGLLVFPAFELTGSVEATVRLVSVYGLLATLIPARRELRPSAAWPDERRRTANLILSGLTLIAWAVNIWIASAGFLMLLFFLWVAAPIGTFANAILEMRVEEAPIDERPVEDREPADPS